MPLILGANSLAGGYQVKNSLRFNSGSSDNLSRTPASASNRKTWTWSGWIKRSALSSSSTYEVFCGDNGATSFTAIRFASDQIYVQDFVSGSKNNIWITNAVYRDPSAWYHLVVKYDTTQASSTNAVLIYINNNSQTLTFDTAGLGAYVQNYDGIINSTNPQKIGEKASTNYFAGYMSEINFIDGQALTPSSFGETDEDTGIWKPKAYTGTFGTNGFYLDFEDSANLGNDMSGNNNDFTVNNLTSIDQTTDTPTNNFCTLNPLNPYSGTLSEGNLKKEQSSYDINARGTFGLTAGKWYWEVKMSTTHGEYGVCEQNKAGQSDPQGNFPFYFVYSNGSGGLVVWNNATSGSNVTINSGYTNFSANAICMIAYDADNGRLYAGLNGTWYNSANPASGTGYLISGITTQFNGTIVPFFGSGDTASRNDQINFGSPPFTIASGNADANGYGNFEYAVPSGYYALCTKNLAQFG